MILPLESDLLPVIGWDSLAEINESRSLQEQERAQCFDEPWYWLVNYVYSIRKDEFVVDGKPETLRFPPLAHLRLVFHRCFTEPKLVVDKSRQMTMTWVMMAYYLYRCQFGEHEEVIVQTKKEVDADLNLIKKAVFMANSQPFWLMPENKYAYCRLRFPGTNSSMRGLAGGAGAGDQIRSANPSRGFIDEGGFMEDFEECRTAYLACCQDLKIVSTANSGQFADFIHDRIAA